MSSRWSLPTRLAVSSLLAVVWLQPEVVAQDLLYGTVLTRIVSVSTDGGPSTEVISSQPNQLSRLAVDKNGGKLYWTMSGDRVIRTANLDGSGIEDLVDVTLGFHAPVDVAVYPGLGWLYWSDTEIIQRIRLDGTGRETVVSEPQASYAIALDITRGFLYFASPCDVGCSERIVRATLDGNDVKVVHEVVTDLVWNLALDPLAQKLYWVGNATNQIWSVNVDGSSPTMLVDNLSSYGLVVDPAAGRVYYTEFGDISAMDLDGANVTEIVSGVFRDLDLFTDCPDADGDGVCAADDCDDGSPHCFSDCTDTDADGWCVDTDCDDALTACTTGCEDDDGDGVRVCDGDCDDTEPSCAADCSDADGDGVRVCEGDCDDSNAGCIFDCGDADGDTFCAGVDCDDTDPSCTTDCADADGDGLRACDGDCDDSSPFCDFDCTDFDGDGHCINFDCDDTEPFCTTDCTDADGDGLCPPHDCDDTDPSCTTDCADADGDGVRVCDGDCDDTSPFCDFACTDADGDGHCINFDCDDTDPSCTTDCTDADGDGLRVCDGDCDDTDPSCTTDCTDADGDGVNVCNGDCDDTNSGCTFDCTDADGDGYCVGVDCDDSRPDCAGQSCFDFDGDGLAQCKDCDDSVATCTLDCTDADGDGIRACDGDCDDADALCGLDCSDADGDGVRACDGDCDDGNALCALDCVDGDGDGLTLCDGDCDNANPNCGLDCTDLDEDGFCPPVDCDDSKPGCDLDCTDGDGDGFCVTADCDDADPDCSVSCTDADGDGFCADSDCTDTVASVFPGAPEDCTDGQDTNCDGVPDGQEAACLALEAANLRFTDRTTLEWDAATTTEHALYRGSIPAEGFRPWDHLCEATRLGGTLAVDTDVPPPGEGFYYLASGLGVAGSGPTAAYTVFLGSGSASPSRPESTLVSCGPRVVVDPDLLLANGDGLSWPTAYSQISSALVNGTAIDRGLEVWVRGSPARAVLINNPRPGFRILGGFAGTESSSWQRDPETTPTTWQPDGTSELLVVDGASVVLDGLSFRNVTTGVDVRLDGGLVALENVTVESISGFAVDLTARAGGTLIVRDSSFDGSGTGAIQGVAEGGVLGGLLRGNTFDGGSVAAVSLTATGERDDAVVDVDILANRFTGGATALILGANVSDQPHDALVSGFVASNWIGGTSGDAVIVAADGVLPSSTLAQSVVASPLIVHNTISDAGAAGLAVNASRTDPSPDPSIHPVQAIPEVWNNLLTFHAGPAVAESSDDPLMGVVADPVVVGNDLFGSGSLYLDEGSLSLLTAGEVNALVEARDNLDVDPNYVDRLAGDYHIANGTVVGLGSTLRYLANQADPGIGVGWVQPLFDDSSWSVGFYGVGYDTGPAPNALGYLFTQVPAGSGSVYTRTTFTVDDPLDVQQLVLGVDHDDGYVAWLNGVEVSRSVSMLAGDPAWNTAAASHESSNAATPQYELVDITATGLAALLPGQNVLAVGGWNDVPASSDLALAVLLVIDDESAIIDAAQPDAPRVPLEDIDGDRRGSDGNLDGTGRSDLGGGERR